MWCGRVFVVLCILCVIINAKRYDSRCKLVRDAIKSGLPNDIFLGQWVCLIEKVSNRDTAAFVVSPSGKRSYGLYQIPSKWCREGKKGGECNVACESLLDDDIRDDTACAVKIFHREGFKYWTLWSMRCKNDNLITTEIYKCPDLVSPRFRYGPPERDVDDIMNRNSSHYKIQFNHFYLYFSIITIFMIVLMFWAIT